MKKPFKRAKSPKAQSWSQPGKFVFGKLASKLVYEKDIVSPLGEEMWDACKPAKRRAKPK